jgi:hypothetical protein
MAINENPTDPSRGLFRVPVWFGIAAVGFLASFLFRLKELQPNWLILGVLVLVSLAIALNEFKGLVALKSGTGSERKGTMLAILGAALVAIPLIYFSWKLGPAVGIRIVDTYLPPVLVPFTATIASVAFYVERKYKSRVYIGNKGWVFLSQEPPSNRTIERDAGKSDPRPSS